MGISHFVKDFYNPFWLGKSDAELYIRREIYTGRYNLPYIHSALLSKLP